MNSLKVDVHSPGKFRYTHISPSHTMTPYHVDSMSSTPLKLQSQQVIHSVCPAGYWARFRISRNLQEHSAATREATWSLRTFAMCGDPQTSGLGAALAWTTPVLLQYFSPDCWSINTGLQGSVFPHSSLLVGPRRVDQHCSVHFLQDKQWTAHLWTNRTLSSDSDTVVCSNSLIILLLTGYNPSLCFFSPLSSCFSHHSCVYVNVF